MFIHELYTVKVPSPLPLTTQDDDKYLKYQINRKRTRYVLSLPVLYILILWIMGYFTTKQQILYPAIHLNSSYNSRQRAIADGALHAWKAYYKYAFPRDELLPISKTGKDWFGLGLTVIDSLDTLFLMSRKDDRHAIAFKQASDWVRGGFKVDKGYVQQL